jgi:hypothetical protein
LKDLAKLEGKISPNDLDELKNLLADIWDRCMDTFVQKSEFDIAMGKMNEKYKRIMELIKSL